VRLLIDANLSPRVVATLRSAGHDVAHVFEIGLGDAADETILAHAGSDQRVIVSSDTDFGALLARRERATPSFVLLRHVNDLSPDAQAELLVAGLPGVESELNDGAVVSFARGRVRTRRLPFGRT
jgi:predicted nuclease of predicted toxin-antitoxin system